MVVVATKTDERSRPPSSTATSTGTIRNYPCNPDSPNSSFWRREALAIGALRAGGQRAGQLPWPGPAFYAVGVETLTFLFTDIEGSTALLQRVGDGVYGPSGGFCLARKPSSARQLGDDFLLASACCFGC